MPTTSSTGCMRNYGAHFRAVPNISHVCPVQSSSHHICAGGAMRDRSCQETMPRLPPMVLTAERVNTNLNSTATAQEFTHSKQPTLLRPDNSQAVHRYRLCGVHEARKDARNSS